MLGHTAEASDNPLKMPLSLALSLKLARDDLCQQEIFQYLHSATHHNALFKPPRTSIRCSYSAGRNPLTARFTITKSRPCVESLRHRSNLLLGCMITWVKAFLTWATGFLGATFLISLLACEFGVDARKFYRPKVAVPAVWKQIMTCFHRRCGMAGECRG